MASIFDVSKYILAHFDQPISPHKLQTLTYLSSLKILKHGSMGLLVANYLTLFKEFIPSMEQIDRQHRHRTLVRRDDHLT